MQDKQVISHWESLEEHWKEGHMPGSPNTYPPDAEGYVDCGNVTGPGTNVGQEPVGQRKK